MTRMRTYKVTSQDQVLAGVAERFILVAICNQFTLIQAHELPELDNSKAVSVASGMMPQCRAPPSTQLATNILGSGRFSYSARASSTNARKPLLQWPLPARSIRASYPLTHELKKTRLPKRSWVKISQIRTLSTERIGKKISAVDPEELAHIIEGLNEIIGA